VKGCVCLAGTNSVFSKIIAKASKNFTPSLNPFDAPTEVEDTNINALVSSNNFEF
jgi:hypothetical protein